MWESQVSEDDNERPRTQCTRLFSKHSGPVLTELLGQNSPSPSSSPPSLLLASASERTVVIHDLDTRALLHTLTLNGLVLKLANGGNNRLVTCAENSRNFQVWSTLTGECLFVTHTSSITHYPIESIVGISDDLIACSWPSFDPKVYNLATKTVVGKLRSSHLSKLLKPSNFSSQKQQKVVLSQYVYELGDLNGKGGGGGFTRSRVLFSEPGLPSQFSCLAHVTLDDRDDDASSSSFIVAGGQSGSLGIWDLNSGARVRTWQHNDQSQAEVTCVVGLPGGKFISVVNLERDLAELKVWDVRAGVCLQTLMVQGGHGGRTQVSLQPNGLVAILVNGELRLWR